MPLSNTTLQILASPPYFDDYNDAKGFLRMLFRPGFGIQTRELTQLQTILQNQLSRMGSYLFQDGLPVTGGQLTFSNQAETVRVNLTFGGPSVNTAMVWNATTFTGALITGNTSGAQARVVGTQLSADGTAIEFVTLPLGTIPFVINETLTTPTGNTSTAFAQVIANANTATSDATIVRIASGVYFLRGFFVNIDSQTIIIDSTTAAPSARVGLTIGETIVDELDDPSLLDPAIGSPNFAAAGAHRLVVSGTLTSTPVTTSSVTSGSVTAEATFIDLMRIDAGVVTKNKPATLQNAIYSVLGNSIAARTYDEAGNFLVNPFVLTFGTPSLTLHGSVSTIANSYNLVGNNTIFTTQLNAGDSVNVGGQTLTITRIANDTLAIANVVWTNSTTNQMAVRTRPAYVTASLGPGKAYVQGFEFQTVGTTNLDMPKARTTIPVLGDTIATLYGSYTYVNGLVGLPVLPLAAVDLHCVIPSAIVSNNANTYAQTLMGSAKLRGMIPDRLHDDGTLRYRAYLTQLQPGTYSNTTYANSTPASGILNLVGGAQTNGAYVGARLTLTDFNGNTNTYKILTYTGNRLFGIATVDRPVAGLQVIANTAYVVSFNVGQLESLVTVNSIFDIITSATIDAFGQFNGQTVITETEKNRLLFPAPHPWIQQGSYASTTYTLWSYFSNTHSSNTCTVLTANNIQRFYPQTGYTYRTNEITFDFIISDANNVVLSTANIASITTNTPANNQPHTMTIHTLGTATASLQVWTRVNVTPMAVFRVKTLQGALTATWSGNLTDGQVAIAAPNTSPNRSSSLQVSDVVQLVKVVDTGNTATAPTTAILNNSSLDVTASYSLDTGQRDSRYDHASVVLNPGATPARGQLAVVFTRYLHTGTGPIVVDSYANVTYENIQTYTNPRGIKYRLRDMVDFRPVVDANATTISNVEIPDPQSTLLTNYAYYIGRIDKLILTADRKFVQLPGVPAIKPVAPPDAASGMTLYTVKFAPYTLNTTMSISQTAVGQRRYTMQDIGVLDTRISRLESYASLSLLESTAASTPVYSNTNLERFKNSILVDPFTSASTVASVTDPDYRASIDTVNGRLYPSFIRTAVSFVIQPNASANFTLSPDQSQYYPAYVEVPAVVQPLASEAIPVNPFNVTAFRGTMILDPPTDIWYDTATAPAVTVDTTGGGSASALANLVTGTVWGDWVTNWAGQPPTTVTASSQDNWVRTPTVEHPYQEQDLETTTVDTTTQLQRTGTQLTAVPTTVTSDIGNRVVSVQTVPYVRAANIIFSCLGLKPNATVYPFFNGVPTGLYTERANQLVLDVSNAVFDDTRTGTEQVSSAAGGVATLVYQNGNLLKIVESNANGTFLFANNAPTLLTGLSSNAVANVVSVIHWSGVAQSANSSAVVLQPNASTVNDFYTGLTIRFVAGTGAGTKGIITAYTSGLTNIATVAGLTIVPDTTTRYSIGEQTTDAATAGQPVTNTTLNVTAGLICGVLYFPGSPAVMVPTGAVTLRLVDRPGNVPDEITTIAEAQYIAQGTLDTVQDVSISTRQYRLVSSAVTETSNVTSVQTSSYNIRYIDPLAQSFLVDLQTYPQGLLVTSIDCYFKTKDTAGIPIRLQLRPMVNGYPDRTVVLGEVWLAPSDVQTPLAPDVSNDGTRTRFTFPQPVQLQPNNEYAFVLLSDSQDYTAYVGTLGSPVINGSGLVSSQPAVGSLFESQNAQTWTAEQGQDLMFRLNRASFTPGQETIVTMGTSVAINVVADSVFLNPGGVPPITNSVVAFSLQTTAANGSMFPTTSAIPVLLDVNTPLTFAGGRAYLFAGSGNTMSLTALWSPASESMAAWVDSERLGLTLVAYNVSNSILRANVITIDQPGLGYPASNTSLPIVFTGTNGGNGAIGVATSNSNGSIISVTITNGGGAYIGNPTAVINASNSSAAVLTIHGEGMAAGGYSNTGRYITKSVTLSDGFDSVGLVITIDAYRPVGTNVDIYYKVLSADDVNTTLTQRPWTLTTMETDATLFSANPADVKTYTYNPTNNTCQYTSNSVVYQNFKQYQVKAVLRTQDTTNPPVLHDIQILALDS